MMNVDPGYRGHKTMTVRFTDWQYERRLDARRLWVRYWPYARIRQLDTERRNWKRWYMEGIGGDE